MVRRATAASSDHRRADRRGNIAVRRADVQRPPARRPRLRYRPRLPCQRPLHLWRCTDIGSRVVVAIRLDRAETVSVVVRGGKPGPETRSVIDSRDDPSWFNGPPYAIAETVFDEYDFPACRPVAEEDVMDWTPDGPTRR